MCRFLQVDKALGSRRIYCNGSMCCDILSRMIDCILCVGVLEVDKSWNV